jgi:UDP:flavonoid glycosyltransferase YjiC (YdhE family)
VRAAGLVFPLARPVAFALHTRPLNRVRREHGLPSLGPDLRRAYTDADRVLFADAPELAPPHTLAPGHEFLGPVLWEPAATPPTLPDGPLIYVTLGSSGQGRLLAAVVRAAQRDHRRLPAQHCRRPASRAGRVQRRQPDRAAGPVRRDARTRAGGEHGPTPQHAIGHHGGRGTPGPLGARDPTAITRAARRLLDEPDFRTRAKEMAERFADHDAPAAFARAVEQLSRQ